MTGGANQPAKRHLPTIDMWRALLDMRARRGRYWQRALLDMWRTGADEREPFAASLRLVRNQLGPTWLGRLSASSLDAAAGLVAAFDSLPRMCATRLPGFDGPIVLRRGESGYWRLPEGWTVEGFNELFEASPAQIAAMEAGSMFGWAIAAADPRTYDEEGKPIPSDLRNA